MKTEFGRIGTEVYWQDRRTVGKMGRYQVTPEEAQEFEETFAQTKYQQSLPAAGKILSQEELRQAYDSMGFKRANVIKAYEDEVLKDEADLEEKNNTKKATEKKTEKKTEKEESQTETDIIVKPDGSRVLVVTTNVGGMETTVSLKISEPTDMPNDSALSVNDSKDAHSDMETMWRENLNTGITEE